MSIATGQINIQNIDETLSVSLSSDSHVFPGAVSTALAGQVDIEVEAFLGVKQIDCSIETITPTPPKELAITVVPTQNKTKIVRFAATTGLSQSGTYNIYVKAAGTTVKKTFSYAIAFKGNTGNTGPKGATGVGVSSITEYYLATAASSGVTSGAGAWSTTIQTITADKKYLWNYEKVNFDDGTSSPTLPVIIGVYGDKGDTGKTGNTGRSITKIEEFYLTTSASSGVVRTSGAWLPNPTPTTPTNKYLWNYERITWSSGTTPTYVEPFIIGIHGDEGKKGDPGKGISSATVTYQAGSSGTVAPTGTWSTTIPAVAANQYLWTRTVITYTDNKTSTAYAVGKMGAQGPQGNTGPTGNGIDSTKVTYQASSSGTVAPTGTWQTTVPSVADNQYLWTRVVINYTSGSPTTSYSVGKMGAQGPQGARGPQGVQGATGKQGPIGDTGTSVSSIVEWYLATNLSSGVTTSTDGWKTTMQSMTATKKYLWNYEVINFSDGSSSPTIPVIIGVYGNTGATGRALTGITEYYLASATASGVTRPSTDGAGGWTTTMQPTSISKPYLWNYEKLAWSVAPTTTYVEPIVIGVHGPQGPQGPQGSRGPQGIQGPIGPDGKATYTWIKYADTPTTGMKDLPDGKTYMGIAHNKLTETESTDYSDYTWSLIKGEQGIQGPNGKDGTPRYTWIKYADDENGSGMNDSPTGKRFLGLAHNKTTATESTKASDYQWSPLYDNVVVGGRNLFSLHHLNSLSSSSWTVRAYLYEFWLKPNTEYILSTNLPVGQNSLYFNGGDAADRMVDISKSLIKVTDEEGYFFIAIPVGRSFVSQIFSGEYWVKLERGNIATDWTPAPEDIEERLVSHDARIDTTEREIALRATTAAVGSIDTRLKAAELKVTADAITSTVRKSTDYINDQGKKVSTNEIISKINQSAEKITIEASKINIKGKVTFESFDSSTAAEINSKARTFTSTPVPPYSLGDIWKNSTSTYMCKVARATGSYVAADWEKTGDVTSANKAADTAKVGGTAATTVVTGATAGSAAKTATDRWTYTGKTTINGGQIQADTVTATQIKAKTITASEIAANTITVNQLASSVGSSLDLSSNTAITSRVTSTQMSTALKGKEDSIFMQASAPAHKVGRLWLDTSTATNQLKRSDGTKWVVVSDVQVGGRNYLRQNYIDSYQGNSTGVVDGWYLANSGSYGGIIFSSAYLEEGYDYTISFEYKTEDNNGWWTIASPRSATSDIKYNTNKSLNLIQDGKIHKKVIQITATSTEEVSICLLRNGTSGAVYYKENSLKVEKGNIATDWTPAPEDIQADMEALAGEVEDVSQAVTDLDDYIDIAFHDGIIGEVEARTIEKYLNIVNSEKADVDAKYTKLYANTLLGGTAKTGLYSVKSTYNTAHTNLISAINTAIRGGTATNAEKTNVDAKFTAYRTALTNLSTAFEVASAYLVDAVNGRFDGPTGVLKRLTEAESKVTDDAIIGTVSQKTTSDGKPLFAKTSEVKQTVDTWTAKFSSIGGVNLLKATESTISNTSYPTATYTMAENMVAGQKYTITIWGQLGAGKSSFTAYLNGGSIQLTTIPLKSTGVYRATFTGRAGTTPNPNIINIYPMPSGVSATSRIDKVQLEKGEVGTEWTPHPDELYTGVTKINKDGVTVGIEGETIEANLRFDGIEIKDGATPIASFTGSGASIKNLKADSISGDVVNTLSSSVTLNVGKAAGYFATVEQALASTGNAKYLGLDVVLTINIYDILNEDVSIAGFTGAGKVVVNLHGRINGHLWTEGNSCLLEIYGKTTGNVIKGTGYPYLSRGDSGVYVDNIVADAMNSANSVGFMIREGSTATLRGADIVNSQDGIMVRDGAIAQITYARGNVTRYGVYSHSGVSFLKATVPTSGNTAIARSLGGFVVQDGTPTQENSRFSPPATSTGPETRTFNQTDIYTYSVKYGAKSTHYGKAAAQNRWDTSMTQMKGRIVFGSSVYSFIAGRNSGTTPTVKIRLRRQNSSHGSSSSVKPTPEWSGAPSFGGATRGNWTAWVTIPYTLFKSSGYEFSFYNGSTGNSYAIWDRAEVQITRTITQ